MHFASNPCIAQHAGPKGSDLDIASRLHAMSDAAYLAADTALRGHLNVAATCLQAAGSGSRMEPQVCESENACTGT